MILNNNWFGSPTCEYNSNKWLSKIKYMLCIIFLLVRIYFLLHSNSNITLLFSLSCLRILEWGNWGEQIVLLIGSLCGSGSQDLPKFYYFPRKTHWNQHVISHICGYDCLQWKCKIQINRGQRWMGQTGGNQAQTYKNPLSIVTKVHFLQQQCDATQKILPTNVWLPHFTCSN
jgi:hypothetical protein